MKKVTAAVIERRGRILIARRRSGGTAAGKWEFPGGTVKAGETPEQCLFRELREELGIDARVGEFIGSSRAAAAGSAFDLLAFHIKSYRGRVRPIDHDEIRWVDPKDLPSFDLAEADLRLLPEVMAALGRGEKSECE